MPAPAITGTVSQANTANSVSSLTFAHTATGDVLYVSGFISDAVQQFASVTYGGVALTRLGRVTGSSFSHEWWWLSAPVAGTANVVLTLDSGTNWLSAAARNVSGVDRDGVFRNLTSAAGSSTTPSVTVASAVGDLVLDMVGNETNSQVFTPGAGQTADWAQNSQAGSDSYTAGSQEAGAASVVMSWTLALTGTWLISGLSVPADGTVPPLAARATQLVAETLTKPTPEARVTQVLVETLTLPNPLALLSQAAVEVLSQISLSSIEARVSQVALEVLWQPVSTHPAHVSQVAVEVLSQAVSTLPARVSQVAVEVMFRPAVVGLGSFVWMGDHEGTIWIE